DSSLEPHTSNFILWEGGPCWTGRWRHYDQSDGVWRDWRNIGRKEHAHRGRWHEVMASECPNGLSRDPSAMEGIRDCGGCGARSSRAGPIEHQLHARKITGSGRLELARTAGT